MVGNKLIFPEHTGSLNLVSTQAFKLRVKGRAESVVEDVRLDQLADDELRAILLAIRAEHSLANNPDCTSCTHLTVTSLSLRDHSTHAMGVLGAFLEELYPGEKIQLPAIFRTLCDEIKRKTNVEIAPTDFEQLCSERSISRDRFSQILTEVRPAGQFETMVQEAVEHLRQEGMPFDELRQLRSAFTLVEVGRMDSTDLTLKKARQAVEVAVKKLRTEGTVPTSLRQAIIAVEEMAKSRMKKLASVRSTYFGNCLASYPFYPLGAGSGGLSLSGERS
jgi:biotin operon repressor